MKLPVPREILNQHVAVLGKTRSGKSSVLRLLVEDLLDRQQPVCIVDPKGDWYGIKLAGDGKRPGYPVVIFGGEHADIPINEHAGAHVAELFATGNRPCLIDLGGWMPGARTQFWIDFASTLFRFTKGTRWLAVDEVHNFAPKGKVMDPQAGKALHWTNRLASEGLGKGVAMLFASQRPQKVHNDTLTSAETLIAMRVLHPSDRGAVADWIKGCGDSEGSEVLNSLAQMDRGEGWVWSPEIGFGPKRVKFPLFSTYDSFRPQSVEDTKKLKGWAEVDLDEVRSKMAVVVEQAKADDPRELRKQLAEANRMLVNQAKAIGDLQARKPAEKGRVVEKPVLTNAHIAALDTALGRLEKAIDRAADVLTKPFAGVREQLGVLAAAVKSVRQPTLPMPAMPPSVAAFGRQFEAGARTEPRRPSAPAPRVPPSGGNGDVGSGGLRRILVALAQRPQGLTQKQIGVRAGLSSRSGTFSNYMSKARQAGWIEDGGKGGPARITDAGVTALGTYDPLPEGAALLAHWRAELGGGTARILEVLAAAYPETISQDDLGARAELNPRSGTFSNYMSKLRTLELIESGRGWVRASAELFS